MLRGVERRAIFVDDADREDFLARLDRLVPELGFRCFAWALMSNHVHLVLQSAALRISQLIARVATGYALRFNRRHDRVGHLFQNRFGSRIATGDADLIGLVAYVHRNPLEARIVRSEPALRRFAWCGHGALVGVRAPRPFESVTHALGLLGADPCAARRRMREIVAKAPEAVPARPLEPWRRGGHRRTEPRVAPDDSVRALRRAVEETARAWNLDPDALRRGRRAAAVVAREQVAITALRELSLPRWLVARELGLSAAGLSRAVARAERNQR